MKDSHTSFHEIVRDFARRRSSKFESPDAASITAIVSAEDMEKHKSLDMELELELHIRECESQLDLLAQSDEMINIDKNNTRKKYATNQEDDGEINHDHKAQNEQYHNKSHEECQIPNPYTQYLFQNDLCEHRLHDHPCNHDFSSYAEEPPTTSRRSSCPALFLESSNSSRKKTNDYTNLLGHGDTEWDRKTIHADESISQYEFFPDNDYVLGTDTDSEFFSSSCSESEYSSLVPPEINSKNTLRRLANLCLEETLHRCHKKVQWEKGRTKAETQIRLKKEYKAKQSKEWREIKQALKKKREKGKTILGLDRFNQT